ncbi:hypothetical protein SAMN04489729_3996 [Amycolatopsis lurida]|uniref:Uncharacterized protein n=1 Tax=Amycolatopsis lurida NRRL 2430 TaxID=1460371 RepID=A0A2P2G2F5_AMYLU|nr:hypothetical protein [Amycolatopsis lurida]KFU83158.1 hypothetical protein BB31_01310 [Amycolatopsis lurida NRRL 2430]SED30999.1 hypothetical protein SAMN04489729_3996 [Amycolatopsis lurida]
MSSHRYVAEYDDEDYQEYGEYEQPKDPRRPYEDVESYEPYEPFDDDLVPEDPRAGRGVRRVLSGAGGLILTPVALGLLAWGGLRQQMLVQATLSTQRDVLSIGLLVGGGILLLSVGLLGALSATGPILGGLVWGVAPGVVTIAVPEWGFRLVKYLPQNDVTYGVTSWLFIGGLLATGFLLIGAGLASRLARRRR